MDGDKTLEENIADNGGLNAAFMVWTFPEWTLPTLQHCIISSKYSYYIDHKLCSTEVFSFVVSHNK